MTTLISLGSLLAAGLVLAATATLSDAVAQQHPRELRMQSIKERAGLAASDQLDGPYYIVNRYSGKCLNVKDASVVDLAPVIQYTCGSPLPNDKWWILRQQDGLGYYLLNDHSYKCLNVKDASKDDDAPIIQYTCKSPLPNDVWSFHVNTWDWYFNRYSGKCLRVKESHENGAPATLYPCHSLPADDAWLNQPAPP
jgi:hypothetical protein